MRSSSFARTACSPHRKLEPWPWSVSFSKLIKIGAAVAEKTQRTCCGKGRRDIHPHGWTDAAAVALRATTSCYAHAGMSHQPPATRTHTARSLVRLAGVRSTDLRLLDMTARASQRAAQEWLPMWRHGRNERCCAHGPICVPHTMDLLRFAAFWAAHVPF